MLTGLLFLLVHAGRVEGQAAQFHAEYLHHSVYTGGQAQTDRADGVAVAVDGTAFAAVTRTNSAGTKTIARFVSSLDGTSAATSFGATFVGNSVAHAAASGVLDIEMNPFAFIAPANLPIARIVGYLAGSYDSSMTITLADPDSSSTTSVVGPTAASGSVGFAVRALSTTSGPSPIGAAFVTNDDGVELLTIATSPCTGLSSGPFSPNCNAFPGLFVGGYVRGSSEIEFTGHMYVPGFGYRTGSVSNDPTNSNQPVLQNNGASEAGFACIIQYTQLWMGDRFPLLPSSTGTGPTDMLGAMLLIDAAGDDRVLDVEVNPLNGDIVICGYYSSSQADFHPHPFVTYPSTAAPHIGGKDMFVAKYTGVGVGQYPSLVWLFVHGTSGDDMANAVAIDSDGSVYVAGTTHDPINGVPGDIFIARIQDPPPLASGEPQLLFIDELGTWDEYVWAKTYFGTGIDTAEDVTIDHLNRPVFTGQFGYETSGDVPLYFLSFDPAGGSGATVITHGGSDAYLLRLRPDTASSALLFDFALAFGDNHDEVGTGVAPNPYNRGELVHCGSFGSSFSTTAYGVDFDPSSATDIAFTAGKSDPFVNRFSHCVDPEGPSISLMIDVSNSNATNIEPIMESLSDQLSDNSVVAQDEGIKVNVTLFGLTFPTSLDDQTGDNDLYAKCIVPWTTVTPTTAPLLARKLVEFTMPERGPVEDTGMDDALLLNGYLVESAQILSGSYGYTSACLIADMPNDEGSGTPPNLTAARDWAVDADRFDQINVLCVQGTQDNLTRNYAMEFACESLIDVPALNTSNPIESHLGFANNFADVMPGGTSTQLALFQDYLTRFLLRMTHCPGDYNLDGAANGPLSGQDWLDMIADYGSANPYTDWNFDEDWPLPFEAGKVDFQKFLACFDALCP